MKVGLAMKKPFNFIVSTSMYWIIVHEDETGDFKNAQYYAQSGKSFDYIKERFQKKHPGYRVVNVGEGLENRPYALAALPYIDRKNTQ